MASRRLQADRPQQRAALDRPPPADQIAPPVAGPVVDRAQEDRRVGVWHMGEARRLVVDRELSHSLGQALDRVGVHFAGRHRADATATYTHTLARGYHQTVESMPSSSSTGFV